MSASPGASDDGQVLVERPGMLTTVQDGGRFGWQHVGVVPSGAMDCESFQLTNALVGNLPDAAGLEITLRGPTLLFECDALVALGGAHFAARVNADGHDAPCPLNRPVLLRAGSRLSIEQATHGFRAYLALAGGINLAPVLGSRCTYMPAAIGGVDGRALKMGDRLPLVANASVLAHERFDRMSVAGQAMLAWLPYDSVRWAMLPRSLPQEDPAVVRCIDGHHRGLFTAAALEAFVSSSYRISSQSNRMGYRMLGEKLERSENRDVLSEPTTLGTVQVPPDGLPIVLMADHQTTGGYAKIAEVASADIGRLAQLRPGQAVRFERCSVSEALALAQAAHGQLQSTLAAIGLKLNPGALNS